ncbi:MAG: chemotaxis protein CheX [Planctomycetes bacterium]|nr:chemotaxis protein CheX [Planctomycetota bacterium]
MTEAAHSAVQMCNTKIRCVGVSSMPGQESGMITGMIGVHGKVSGFVSVNMSERFAICAVEGLLNEKFGKLSSQVIDGAGELTNIIVGGIKGALANTKWGFSNITVPSVIVGQNFMVAYSKGLEFLTVTFEHDDEDAFLIDDRMVHVSMSLLSL